MREGESRPWSTCQSTSGPAGSLRPSESETLLRSGLKLRHMRMIVALEDHGQISAAAQVMNMSQPAASRMIAEIEDILGVQVCERLPRGIRLTPYGAALARRGRAILLEMQRGRPRDFRPEVRQGRLGLPRRGHRAGDRPRGAGDPERSASAIRGSRSPSRSKRAPCWRANCSPRATTSSSPASPTTSIRACSKAASSASRRPA